MKQIGIAIGILVSALVLFVVGLIPSESILTEGNPDSYILIGVGRFASWVAGACEFILGALLASAVCILIRKRKITEPESGPYC